MTKPLIRGHITWVHPSRRWGFITYTDEKGNEQSLFVHENNLLAWRGGKNSKPPKTLLDDKGKLHRPRLRLLAPVSFVIGEWDGQPVAKRVYQRQPRKRKGRDVVIVTTYLPG